MEERLSKDLIKYFFQAPSANGLLVFEDNEYLGVVLKKDIEFGITTKNFKLFENINFIRISEIEDIIFKENNKKSAKVPVVDKSGNLLKIITYDEFLSHFYFDDFITGFKPNSVFDDLDHPIFITNFFKRCLYTNKKGFELAEFDIIGKNISNLLKKFEIKKMDKGMLLEKNGKMYTLYISHSETKNFYFLVYDFF